MLRQERLWHRVSVIKSERFELAWRGGPPTDGRDGRVQSRLAPDANRHGPQHRRDMSSDLDHPDWKNDEMRHLIRWTFHYEYRFDHIICCKAVFSKSLQLDLEVMWIDARSSRDGYMECRDLQGNMIYTKWLQSKADGAAYSRRLGFFIYLDAPARRLRTGTL